MASFFEELMVKECERDSSNMLALALTRLQRAKRVVVTRDLSQSMSLLTDLVSFCKQY